MDFNKSFLAYDSLDGAACLTNSKRQTQREAALEAVSTVGLNQISEIRHEWFSDPAVKEMFFRRLALLRNAEGT